MTRTAIRVLGFPTILIFLALSISVPRFSGCGNRAKPSQRTEASFVFLKRAEPFTTSNTRTRSGKPKVAKIYHIHADTRIVAEEAARELTPERGWKREENSHLDGTIAYLFHRSSASGEGPTVVQIQPGRYDDSASSGQSNGWTWVCVTEFGR